MNKMKLSWIAVVSLGLVACGSTNSAKYDYRGSVTLPTIEIPPDLTAQSDRENLSLPGSELGKISQTGRPILAGSLEQRVIPNIGTIKLEGIGDHHWLKVDLEAGKLYSQIRDFWIDEGFPLLTDEPVIGIMETNWVENSSGIVEGEGSIFSSLFESLSSNDSEDRYRTRLERVEEDDSTRVYITHRGQELATVEVEGEQSTSPTGWRMRPNDPEAEVEMLSRLMVFLGLQDPEIAKQLSQLGLYAPRAHMFYDDNEEETYLIVSDSYTRAWNRLLNELYRMNIRVDEKDIKDGLIKISSDVEVEVEKTGFWTALFGGTEFVKQKMELALGLTPENNSETRIETLGIQGGPDQSKPALVFLQHLHKSLK